MLMTPPNSQFGEETSRQFGEETSREMVEKKAQQQATRTGGHPISWGIRELSFEKRDSVWDICTKPRCNQENNNIYFFQQQNKILFNLWDYCFRMSRFVKDFVAWFWSNFSLILRGLICLLCPPRYILSDWTEKYKVTVINNGIFRGS